MSNPYDFGFLSELTAINFPGSWLTLEHTFTCDPTISTNGEPFSYSVPALLPNVGASPEVFALGDPNANILNSKKVVQVPALSPSQPPTFETVIYAQVEPVPAFVVGTQGSGVSVFDLSAISALDDTKKNFMFKVITRAHGTSAPPPPPQPLYFVYATGAGWPYITEFTTDTFVQVLGDGNGDIARTDPFKSLGLTPASNDRFHIPHQPGTLEVNLAASGGVLPNVSVQPEQIIGLSYLYQNPFQFASDASAMADWFNKYSNKNGFGVTCIFTTQEWTGAGLPIPPVPGRCSWNINAKLFTGNPSIDVSPTGVVQTAGPTAIASASSNGNNPPSYTMTINVIFAENIFTMSQSKT